jgi:hypothetical protein
VLILSDQMHGLEIFRSEKCFSVLEYLIYRVRLAQICSKNAKI